MIRRRWCRINMLRLSLVIFFLALVLGCSRDRRGPIPSPSSSLYLHTLVERSRKDPGEYLSIVFEIRDRSGKVLHRENTRASNNSRWNVSWLSDDRIRLDSGDIGIHHWSKQSDGTWKKE